MANLKIYQWEVETYPQFLKVHLTQSQAEILLEKWSRHFKVKTPLLFGGESKGAGGYFPQTNRITVDFSDLRLLVLCHEFAHHLETMKMGKSGHRKTFKKELKRVYTYAKRYLPKDVSPLDITR